MDDKVKGERHNNKVNGLVQTLYFIPYHFERNQSFKNLENVGTKIVLTSVRPYRGLSWSWCVDIEEAI